jgi:hypothetical protein
MLLSSIKGLFEGRECSVEPPPVREISDFLAISLFRGLPPFLLPCSIGLDDTDIWVHEFVEASLWEIMPELRDWGFGVFRFSLFHGVTSLSCESYVGSKRVSPDEFWEMVSPFYLASTGALR